MYNPETEEEIRDGVRDDCVAEAFLPADEALIREAAKNSCEPLVVFEAE